MRCSPPGRGKRRRKEPDAHICRKAAMSIVEDTCLEHGLREPLLWTMRMGNPRMTEEVRRRKEVKKIAGDDDDDDDVVEHLLKSRWFGLIMQDLPALL